MEHAQVSLQNAEGHAQVSLQNAGGPKHAQTYLQRRWLSLPADQAGHQSAVWTLTWEMDVLMQWTSTGKIISVKISLVNTMARTMKPDAQIEHTKRSATKCWREDLAQLDRHEH